MSATSAQLVRYSAFVTSPPRLAPSVVAVFAALLLGLAPRPVEAGEHDPGAQAANANASTAQLAGLMIPIAREILQATSSQDLEARLEAHIEAELFADWMQLSLRAMREAPHELQRLEDSGIALEQALNDFVPRVSAVDPSKVREALRLSLISAQLGYGLGQHEITELGQERARDELVEAVEQLFYDVSVPLEVRRAVYAGLESTLCMTSIAYAVGQARELPSWLAQALVDRWVEGQRTLLRVLIPLAREQGLDTSELGAIAGVEELDLEAVRAKASVIAEADSTILQHGARQPSGSWPPTTAE